MQLTRGEVSAAISGNCRIWNININWSIVYPNPRFDLMLKLWKYEPGNLASIISCYLCAERTMKEVCLQETRLLFKWLRCRFANKMQITGSTVRVGRWWAWEHERWLLEDWHALSRRSPQQFQWEMGWSNWLGNQLDDTVMRKIDTCEVIKDVFTSSDGFTEQVIDLKRNH